MNGSVLKFLSAESNPSLTETCPGVGRTRRGRSSLAALPKDKSAMAAASTAGGAGGLVSSSSWVETGVRAVASMSQGAIGLVPPCVEAGERTAVAPSTLPAPVPSFVEASMCTAAAASMSASDGEVELAPSCVETGVVKLAPPCIDADVCAAGAALRSNGADRFVPPCVEGEIAAGSSRPSGVAVFLAHSSSSGESTPLEANSPFQSVVSWRRRPLL